MKLNPELKSIFIEFQIEPSLGILCLLHIYHKIALNPQLESILSPVMSQINVAKIVEKDYKAGGSLIWNYPLYEGEQTEWEWVNKEYRPLFHAVRKDAAGSLSSCLKKMKEFFKAHPAVRKHEVLEAAKMYINSVENPQYLQQADYFIFKNSDTRSSFTSRLEQYLELCKQSLPVGGTNYKMMK